jgi:hypothetical protein
MRSVYLQDVCNSVNILTSFCVDILVNIPLRQQAFAFSGVDVMITIFRDFCQFSVKKLAFFSKTNVMIKILHNIALF